MPIDSSSFAGDRRARRRSPYSERNRPPFSLADFFPRLFRNVTIFRGVTFSLNSSDVKIAEQQQEQQEQAAAFSRRRIGCEIQCAQTLRADAQRLPFVMRRSHL